MKYITASEKETAALATRIADSCRGGETFALIGDLGAGKTAFTRGLAKAFGIRSVSSPTFVLMKVYAIKKHRTIKRLVHVDAYRLASAESLRGIGLLDYLGQSDTVVVIEWADKVPEILPKDKLTISFKHGKDDRRTICIPDRLQI